MLAQVRIAMQAAPVALASLPDDLKRDWVAADGRARIEVFPKGDANDNETLRRFVAAVRVLAPDATGAPVSMQESGRTIVRAFLEAGLWALLSIAVLLALALRRANDVLLTLAPLALSALATLGICAAIDLPLNFANIIALPLWFGIGVAFNIYFVMASRAGRRELLQSSLTRAVIFSARPRGPRLAVCGCRIIPDVQHGQASGAVARMHSNLRANFPAGAPGRTAAAPLIASGRFRAPARPRAVTASAIRLPIARSGCAFRPTAKR
jgi:hypothetical protein